MAASVSSKLRVFAESRFWLPLGFTELSFHAVSDCTICARVLWGKDASYDLHAHRQSSEKTVLS